MRKSAWLIIISQMVIGTMAAGQSTANQSSTVLWYAKPATQWLEALPIGNGRMGACYLGISERSIYSSMTSR
ncbi:glycoside hydrolase N-terminal domain-containing protein [Spirosoma telluris]|uniref:glycoside hydrolase N-terminal domain-containing protein n=1 Tax=Spirosoma telluris TaxID=2183553 RepID=UPI0013148B0C